jgi:hypothetical protein
LAISRSASSWKVSSTSSISNRRWYCLTSAFFGSVRIWISAVLVEVFERRQHRQTADEFGDEAELHQIFRLQFAQHFTDAAIFRRADRRPEADRGLFATGEMILSRPAKAPPQMNRMFVVSTCRNSCCGCLRPPCGGTDRNRAFHDLQKRLLHALARHVAGDRRVVGLARDLVDFVDIDDAALRALDVVVGGLQQLEDDVLDVLADVTGFGQRRGVGHGEGHIDDAGERLGEIASCRNRSGRSA